MSPKGLAVAVSARGARCGGAPGDDALRMLNALVWTAADREPSLSKVQLAQSLRWDARRANRALAELRGYGLIWFAGDPDDGRRQVPTLNVAPIEAWAKGATLDEIPDETASGFVGQIGPDSSENVAYPRARAALPGGEVERPELAAHEAAAAEAKRREDEFQRALASCRQAGLKMPLLLQNKLRGWLYRVAFEDVEKAANEAARFCNPPTWSYLERVLERIQRDALEAARISRFEDWRGRKPWHYAEGGDQ